MLKSNIKNKEIYLDYASATFIDPVVQKDIQIFNKKFFANPSAIHKKGVEVKNLLEQLRFNVAKIIQARREEIVFTSGATESNNLAILGFLSNFKSGHIITSKIEHASVLEIFKFLEKNSKFEVTYLPVEENGIIDLNILKKSLRKDTILVSVMYANNEIGTIQPITEIVKIIRHHRKFNSDSKIVFHTDATQAVNYLPIEVNKLNIDMMSFNGGKIYGPKGIGALYVRNGIKIKNIIFGGDQEFGLRPGTENVSLVLGFTKALELTKKVRNQEVKRLKNLQNKFLSKLSQAFKNTGYDFVLNGDQTSRLPNNVNITILGIPSDLMVLELSARGIYVSEKSACKSLEHQNSHVIEAISTNTKNLEWGSIRFSFGRDTSLKDILFTVKSVSQIIQKLRPWYH